MEYLEHYLRAILIPATFDILPTVFTHPMHQMRLDRSTTPPMDGTISYENLIFTSAEV